MSGRRLPAGRSGKRAKARKPPPNRHILSNRLAKTKEAPTSSQNEPISASIRKLESFDEEVNQKRRDWSGFRIVDIDKVFKDMTEYLCCRKCRGEVTISEVKRISLSSQFEIFCGKCGVLKRFRNSDLVEREESVMTEVNSRFVYASLAMGFKMAGMKLFSAIMDLPPPSQHFYNRAIVKIHKTIKCYSEESMLGAIKEEVDAEGSNDISISGDGSWQRRGFSSKNGVVTAIGRHTGKVVDIEVLSTVCYGCSNYKGPQNGEEYLQWKESHAEECTINHDGSSGMMEVSGMTKIFERSVARAGVRYGNYIGDGDAKTYSSVVKAQPYGPDFIPVKIECTGHVQKRMGTRLRKLKKDLRGKKLKDGKTIGGQGRLTDKKIDQIASFYGNAIRSSNDVTTMHNKIWAIFYHYKSTDGKPEHRLCPTGPESWCKYNKAKSEGQLRSFQHKSSLPVAVMHAIKPVFSDLTDKALLERCVGGLTQNPNESLNAVIWKILPKTVFCGKKVLEIGVSEAVLLFNDGQKSRLKVLERIGVIAGPLCVSYCNVSDRLRTRKAQRWSLDATKEARKAKRQEEKERSEKQTKKALCIVVVLFSLI